MFLHSVLPAGRSLLPVLTPGRHYAYLDGQILNALLHEVASVKEIKRHSQLQHVLATCLTSRKARPAQAGVPQSSV